MGGAGGWQEDSIVLFIDDFLVFWVGLGGSLLFTEEPAQAWLCSRSVSRAGFLVETGSSWWLELVWRMGGTSAFLLSRSQNHHNSKASSGKTQAGEAALWEMGPQPELPSGSIF